MSDTKISEAAIEAVLARYLELVEQQGVREQFEAWYSENKTVPLGAVVPLDWNDSMSTYKHWAAAEAFRVWKAALASLNHGIVDERAFDETIGQRDRYHEAADALAEHIARITGVEIGEHSSVNCPWENAIEAAEDYKPAQAALSTTGKQQAGEVLTDTYVQTVPDKCDRIVWRGHYYHLPINQAGEVQAKEVQPVAHSDSQWIK